MSNVTRSKRGFTLIELLIVVVMVGILALAAIPIVTSNTVDARRSEGEQMLGAARDICRAEFARSGSSATVLTEFNSQVSTGGLDGKYFSVTTFSDTSSVASMDAYVRTNATSDGTGTLDFAWESGRAAFTWMP